MKKFYLLRHEDVHGNSGTGVVAEGVIFDSGVCAMTWLSDISSVTMFQNINNVRKLHSHEGKTEVIVEGNKKQEVKYLKCRAISRGRKTLLNKKEHEKINNNK